MQAARGKHLTTSPENVKFLAGYRVIEEKTVPPAARAGLHKSPYGRKTRFSRNALAGKMQKIRRNLA